MTVCAIQFYKNSQLTNLKNLSFKSENTITPKSEADKIEFSSVKKNNQDMSDGKKLLLGIGSAGLTLYGILVAHNAIKKPSLRVLQKDFKEIFRREVSLDEIPVMLKKYKEILKIKDEKEFCEKAFEQVKKDYGYGDTNLKLTLNDSTDGILGGGWHSSGTDFIIYYKNILKHNGNAFNKNAKAKILGTFFHEFQHVKQTEYCVRTDLDKYVDAIKKDDVLNQTYISVLKDIINNKEKLAEAATKYKISEEQTLAQAKREIEVLERDGYKAIPAYVSEVNQQLNEMKNRLNGLFGKYEKFKTGSDEYKLGEKYTKNYKEYIEAQENSTNEEYTSQLIEKEAFYAERISRKIPRRLKSIWNVFS